MKDKNKENALSALLESRSMTEAAEKANISRRTLYTYMTSDFEFARQYRSLREAQLMSRVERLEQDEDDALQVLTDIMNDQETPPAIRIKAACSVMEFIQGSHNDLDALAGKNITRTDPLDPFHDLTT